MFDLFRKSSKGVKVIDKVWLSNEAKWNACMKMVELDPSLLFVVWFEETFQELKDNPSLSPHVFKAESMSYDKTVGRMVIFAEHYPLASVEEDFFTRLQLKEVPVLSSLEEPIFMTFGGERTIEIMKRLGVGEEEIIGHSMVTRSIRRAQQSIASKTDTDYPARSSKEWFTLNLK